MSDTELQKKDKKQIPLRQMSQLGSSWHINLHIPLLISIYFMYSLLLCLGGQLRSQNLQKLKRGPLTELLELLSPDALKSESSFWSSVQCILDYPADL